MMVMNSLTDQELSILRYDWEFWARPNQRIPQDDWVYWLIKAGRGFGKTRTGAETIRIWARSHTYVNLIGATADDARDIMIEGESGILAICPNYERPIYEPSKRKLTWPNGAVSLIFTADEPDRLRGKQHAKLWCDELASWRCPESWDQAKFGLRLGNSPQAVITTTPRPIAIVREIMKDLDTFITNGSTYDNRGNLPVKFFNSIIKKYEGTRLGRQELNAEILDDDPDALFSRADIEKGRVREGVQYDRIVIGLDPAATNTAKSDATGIVACGLARDQGYVLADKTLKGSPLDWARAAIQLYYDLKADRIVAETNNGGDMVISTIRTIDPNVAVTAVTATRGKALRAEPVAALYEQGRIHHVGMFAELEDQMCEWSPEDSKAKSPDRMDALVWAITELMLGESHTGMLDFIRDQNEREKRPVQPMGTTVVTSTGMSNA